MKRKKHKLFFRLKTLYIRYSRIIRHTYLFHKTGNIEHLYEILHYKYMKNFTF